MEARASRRHLDAHDLEAILGVTQKLAAPFDLSTMLTEVVAAAKQVLQNRINHAPKDETRWREGWFNRCNSYARGL